MRDTSRPHRATACSLPAFVGLTLALACQEPAVRLPVSPTLPVPVSMEITGPDTLAPGQAAQYAALVRLSDGTVKTLWSGAGARWQSGSAAVTVTDSGMVTAGSPGESVLSIVLGMGLRASRDVLVVPEGTFRLVGLVSDAEFPALGIAGAVVEAIPGPGATTTDTTGRYRLYGVPPNAELRVTANGYSAATRTLTLTAHGAQDVSLTLAGPRVGAHGVHTLSIDFDGPCTSLPPEFRHRKYSVFVSQVGPMIEVVLLTPSFRRNAEGKGDRFTGTVAGGTATFFLDHPYYYFYYGVSYPNVVEILGDGTLLTLSGSAQVNVTPSGMVGTMVGALLRWVPPRTFLGSCWGEMGFALTPQ